ncbi:SgcJ/EcaC family oxidoreductase [Phenylobacterium soli]|uniref:Nuclear transport factor 2 family protein n=1 Tax=Phenylobacterium soli TaxID=2170551 RepID=A0A328AT32_9CAUL|nr:SgcJ/EcaC family oxidoreductase [Phenylobacterium soli]RAK56098.1 nuclear transport factor 2 family protein [Phenylobacterium soli]
MRRLTAALVAGAILMGAASPALAGDTDASRIAVAREMIAAWKSADWRKVADLFAEDGVLRSMMLEPVAGRPAIYARIAALGKGAPDGVTLDVAHIGVIDGLVFIERTDRFVYNGHPGAVPVVGVLDIRDGKVREWREYYDRASLEKALRGQ